MERKTKFNLETSVNQWRKELKNSLQFTEENLLELESHMWDEISRLQDLKLTDEEAFVLAKHQLGANDELVTEYGKVNHKLYFVNRLNPYLKGMLLFIALSTFIERFHVSGYLTMKILNIGSVMSAVYSNAIILVFVGSILGIFYRLYKNSNSKFNKLMSYPSLLLIWAIFFVGTHWYSNYIGKVYFETHNSLTADGDIIIPMLTLRYGFVALIIGVALWAARVKKKSSKIVLAR